MYLVHFTYLTSTFILLKTEEVAVLTDKLVIVVKDAVRVARVPSPHVNISCTTAREDLQQVTV